MTELREKPAAVHPAVQKALIETLKDALERTASVPPTLRYRTAWRREGGAWRGAQEPYNDRWPLFDVLRSQEAEILAPLRAAVNLHQDDWKGAFVSCGFVGGRMQLLSVVNSLFDCVLDRIDSGDAPEAAAANVVMDFSTTMERGTLECECVAPLHGMALEPDQPEITLPSGVRIASLSDEEVSDLHRRDQFSRPTHPQMPECALKMKFEQEFVMQADIAVPDQMRCCEELFDKAWLALTTFQAGFVSFTTVWLTCAGPSPIPIGRVGSGVRNPSGLGSYRLARQDVARLQAHAKDVRAIRGRELEIAVRRLAESECRAGGVDAFLDAMIGLDTLLVPQGRESMRFRFALHYALLVPDAEERHRRFSFARELYDLRSGLVHAGNAGPYKLEKTKLTGHEVAEKAKAMLRETIRYFLSLDAVPKEWDRFWKEKYFGALPTEETSDAAARSS